MKTKLLGVVAALALIGSFSVGTAQADPIDVSYTVSGSPGDWLVDFSVTNNLGGGYGIYFFGTSLPSTDIVNSPNSNWAYAYLNVPTTGPSGTSYNNPWCVYACIIGLSGPDAVGQIADGIQPGQTLSGFEAVDTALLFPTSLPWISLAGSIASGSLVDVVNEGTAGATPLPAAFPLFASGLGALGLLGWRRKRKFNLAPAS